MRSARFSPCARETREANVGATSIGVEPPGVEEKHELKGSSAFLRPRTDSNVGNDSQFTQDLLIALIALSGIATYLVLRFATGTRGRALNLPLYAVLVLGGLPLVWRLIQKSMAREFGSDLLAGISIIASTLMGEYLVGSIVVLMLSGGTVLEEFATRRASSVLEALARRMPEVAHRKTANGIEDIKTADIAVGDVLVVFPHEICPVDGVVVEGQGRMNEAYLTGEPFETSKAEGTEVISGAVNGESALALRATKLPVDSRYARIMRVMQETQAHRPRLRRLGDILGAWYTPLAVAIALAAWIASGTSKRFLAVVVIATPCPLLLAIPVAIIGAISLSARRSIIIKNQTVLEQIGNCTTLIFDKTGTLTYGRPELTEVICAPGVSQHDVLRTVASLERYSKHPLSQAILNAATRYELPLDPVLKVSEKPGQGLRGTVGGHEVWITGRKNAAAAAPLPGIAEGLECIVFLDGQYAAAFRFRDVPRAEGKSFVEHLRPRHHVNRVLLVSGDRESEVRYLAGLTGIREVHSSKTPEEKVAIVRDETAAAKTLFVGDGINDAPAMQAATVGVAFGMSSDITAEAADAVVLDASLEKVDELMHIGRRMRSIALMSAVGGMGLSMVGMIAAAFGHLPPIEGAVAQEIIDLVAVLNAVRTALPFNQMSDF
jgi:heavy metal translocating P-type ATPase